MGNTHPSGDPENKMEILLIFESFVFLVWCTQDSHNLIDTQRDEGKNSSQLKGWLLELPWAARRIQDHAA